MSLELYNAPGIIFDWYMEAEEEGYIPCVDDFEQEFGEYYNVQHWAEKLQLPECREELAGEITDESFEWRPPDQRLKDVGMKLSDFY